MSLAHCDICGKDTPGNMKGKPYRHKCTPSGAPASELPGTFVRCMSGHYYAATRGDEECPICEELIRLRSFLGAETRTELAKQMRERASFADTSASLKRLLETWADVIVGAPGVGGLAANRSDLEWEKELRRSAK